MLKMEISEAGLAVLISHEGLRLKAYLDVVGVLTIGVGFTWRSTSFRKWWGKCRPGEKFTIASKMTREEVSDALRFLIKEEYGKAVNRFLPSPVPQHVFDAIVSVAYNLGVGSLKWKWAAYAASGDYAMAAHYLEQTGTTAKGITINGLVRRRKEEAALLLKGVYPHKGIAITQPADPMADGVLRRGERGQAVNELLADLKAIGYYDGVLDGVYGRGAEAAVLAFQRNVGLKVDGIAGKDTLAVLKARVAPLKAKAPTPKPKPQAPAEEPKKIPVDTLPAPTSKTSPAKIIATAIVLAASAVFAWLFGGN